MMAGRAARGGRLNGRLAIAAASAPLTGYALLIECVLGLVSRVVRGKTHAARAHRCACVDEERRLGCSQGARRRLPPVEFACSRALNAALTNARLTRPPHVATHF